MLTKEQIDFIIEDLSSSATKQELESEYEKFLFYNGQTRPIIKKALQKEFKNQNTLDELCARLVPLNIMRKIVDALSTTYLESPMRVSSTGETADTELINMIEEETNINYAFKQVNRYFKLNKKALFEVYLTDGSPSIYLLPAHTYRVYNFDSSDKTKVSAIAKIINEDKTIIWSDEDHFSINKAGEKKSEMEDGSLLNPYKKMPFVYVNSSIFGINPIQSDDLMKMSVCIPVMLTDLLFALKYQCFSVVYAVGFKGDMPFSPNSVINLDFGPNGEEPRIDTVKSNVDADKVLSTVSYLMDLLLSTNNLKSGGIIGQSSVANAVSGVSKMLDNAESIEDKKDQQQIFYKMEDDFWDLLVKYMWPYWLENNLLEKDLAVQFPKDMEVLVDFVEPSSVVSESESVDVAVKKMNAGLSTQKLELNKLYPNFSEEKIMELQSEILKEQDDKSESTVNKLNKENGF
jgi:hypothetical protein